ncbi:hypothetical protein ABFX02_12G054150 [Erythranthe guttata]
MNQLQDKMSSIGVDVSQIWTSKCTHMVIDDFTSMNDDIIDTIVAKKPLVRFSWIELIAGKTICTEMPSSLSHAPTLTFEGVSLKVADQQSREHCLKGHTFLLESIHEYKFKEKLQLLLEAGGAKVVYAETLDPCAQNLKGNLVRVMPTGLTRSTRILNKFNSLPKVDETDIISAVVSGHLDPSIMASSPVLVSSSCSTHETVVADSDVELETATSAHKSVVVNLVESAEDECERNTAIHEAESSGKDCKAEDVHISESAERNSFVGNTVAFKTSEHESRGFLPLNRNTFKPVKTDSVNSITSSDDRNEVTLSRKDKGHSSESENIDVIYIQDLIVRVSKIPQSARSSSKSCSLVDFKLFRKTSTPSGNSFSNLIPFSKYPYGDSEYGNEDVAESVKEEKKQKQMEATADDLFNTEKGRKRAATGPLRGLFTRA